MKPVEFNPEKHILGRLCKRLHEWSDSGQSIRYLKNRYCVYCQKEAAAAFAHTPQGVESHKLAAKRFNKTDKGRVSRTRKRAKGRSREAGHVAEHSHYSAADVSRRFAEFGNKCAYCRTDNRKLIIEHVIPIKNGGSDSFFNIVPACMSCNTSKRNTDAETWFRSRPFFVLANWRAIMKISGS